MTAQHRSLVLLRHAKSAYPTGVPDHERPLAERGIREAALAGDWLRANLPAIDAVLCSTATRARETLERSGIDAPVRYVERLYGATAGTVIEEINEVADDVGTLLVVGHEPTMSEVAIVSGQRRWHRYRCAWNVSRRNSRHRRSRCYGCRGAGKKSNPAPPPSSTSTCRARWWEQRASVRADAKAPKHTKRALLRLLLATRSWWPGSAP